VASPKFIIYALIDPRSLEWRYIGKSSYGLERPKQHGYPSVIKKTGRQHKTKWVASLIKSGLTYGIEILETLNDGDKLAEAESEWIAEARRQGVRLTNATNGGEGTSGWTMPMEVRQKIGDAQRGPLNHAFGKPSQKKGRRISQEAYSNFMATRPRGESHVNYGRERSEITKQRISAARMGHSVSDETRKKIGIAHTGKVYTEEQRFNCATKRYGRRRPFVDQNGNVYKTPSEAARKLGLRDSNIGKVLRGERTHTGGYRFSYQEE